MARILGFVALIVWGSLAGSSSAQPATRPAAAAGSFPVPAAGTLLPVVALYDDQGRGFSTGDLRGSYAVLVFGCLT